MKQYNVLDRKRIITDAGNEFCEEMQVYRLLVFTKI